MRIFPQTLKTFLFGKQQGCETLGLAYDLDTKSFPNPHFFAWDQVLQMGDSNLFSASENRQNNDIQIPSYFDANYSEFDVIIRSTTYAQDFYIISGSYRAFFTELNGGAGAWAWDGFITFVRAHNIGMVDNPDIPVPPPDTTSAYANDRRKFWVTPGIIDGLILEQPFSSINNAFFTYLCRMPYEVEPDLTGLGSDSTPGVYAIDVAKFGPTTGSLPELIVYAGGHQRIASSEGMTTSQNYSGWLSKLVFVIEQPFVISTVAPVPGGKEASVPYAGLLPQLGTSFTASWKGDQPNHINRYLPAASPELFIGFQKAIEDEASTINTTSPPYATFNFDLLTATDNGYYISRIHDLVVTNGGPFPLSFAASGNGNLESMTMSITGEAIADDGAGAVSFTTPFISFWQPDALTTFNKLYTALGNKNWGLDASLPAYNLNGAYGTVIMPTFSQSPDPIITNVTVGIDNVTHGATTSAEIYVANWGYCLGAQDLGAPNNKPLKSEVIFPFAVKGGSFETATGYTLPEKWVGKAIQQATYNRQDEATAKDLEVYEFQQADPNRATADALDYQAYADRELEVLLESDPTLGGLQPDPLNFLVPFLSPNYYQYGTSNKGDPPAGIPANVAYGLLGYSTGVGPVIFMYDYGTLFMSCTNQNPTKYVLGIDSTQAIPVLMISVGESLNKAIIGGSSTTRRPVSARWDADRDQWIFTFADTTGGSLVSCNSAFNRQPPTQIAYLDQTDQFSGIDSDAKSSLFISRNMTPFLDGLVLFGGEVDTTSKGQAAIKAISVNTNIGGNPATVTGFQPYVIQGTTGREARVWVDYLLFDGVDSMIATELQSMGLRVTVENVEWYKAKILKAGKLGITPEEIEDWVRSQQTEYRETLKLKERQGRLRTRRRQQAAWREGLEDTIAGDFQETTGFDSLEALDKASETFVPSPSDSAPISGNKSKKHSSIQKTNSDKKQDSDS